MKNIFMATLLVLSTNAFSAEFLIKLSRIPGFSPNPTASDLTINDRGQITYRIANNKGTTTTKLGVLSDAALTKLKDKIELIADNAKLENLDANRPRCMDAPSTRILVNKGGKEITISSKVACRRSAVSGTEELANLVVSLETLGR